MIRFGLVFWLVCLIFTICYILLLKIFWPWGPLGEFWVNILTCCIWGETVGVGTKTTLDPSLPSEILLFGDFYIKEFMFGRLEP